MNARVHQPVHTAQHALLLRRHAQPTHRVPSLAGEEQADVCVVGGGFSG